MRLITSLLVFCAMAGAQSPVPPGRVIAGGYYNKGLWHQVVQPGETITLYRTIAGHHNLLVSQGCTTCPATPDKITFSVGATEDAGQEITVSLLTYEGTLIWSAEGTLEPFTTGGNGILPDVIGLARNLPMTTPEGLLDGSGRFRADVRNDSDEPIELLLADGPNFYYYRSGEQNGYIVSGWLTQ